jgi:hypothetical protein
LFVLSLAMALAAAGCSVFRGGGGAEPAATASTGEGSEQIDVRRLLGPDYCPELRILDGAQLVRSYERGHEDDPAYVIWQASFGNTARECLYDAQGGLTVKVGVSGRVIAGPKGAPGEVTVPFKIAIVKFKEAVLASQGYTLAMTLPSVGSTTFTEVREIAVPSPGSDRDYIIYLGFDVGEWDLEKGIAEVAPVEPPQRQVAQQPPPVVDEPPAAPPPPPPPQKPAEPNVLPTPSEGFVLPR